MRKDSGRVASPPGSREPSPSVSAASGFDPSRVRETTTRLRQEFEMTERVAKAIFLSEHPGAVWRAGRARAVWFNRAGAAIREMREPTEDMVANAWISRSQLDEGATFGIVASNIWRAMVDAAIFPRDSDGSGEAGQTAKQAGPVGRQRGPKASPNPNSET